MKIGHLEKTLLTLFTIFFLVFLSFPLSLLNNFSFDQIKIIGVLILVVIVYHRFLFPKIALKSKQLALYLEVGPFILLIPLVILVTGGFLSPLLITAHLSALALAVLIAPSAAMTYLLTTLIVLGLQIGTFTHFNFEENFSALVISFVSFPATIPLFFIFSKHQETQKEWVNYLDKQVSTNEAQERTLLANLSDSVIVLDTEDRVLLMNTKAEDLTGFSQTEAMGKKYATIINLEDENQTPLGPSPSQRVILSGKTMLFKGLFLRKGDQTLKVRVRFSPIKDRAGTLLGLVLVVSEASSATELQEVQSDNLALALFKFNTLLSDIRSYNATLLTDQKIIDPERTYIDRISHINQDLLRLTEDFLLSIRLDSQQVSLSPSEVNIGEILVNTIDNLKTLADKESITFQTSPVKESVVIKTDRTLLTKAFTNLFVMAARLTEDKNEISVEAGIEDEKIKVYVDLKTGLKDLDTRILKEQFYGGSDLFITLPKSSGLEIYLADNIFQLLGGSLSITQNPADTSQLEFLVELPLL